MKLKIDLNIAQDQLDNVHGYHKKIGVVLHETVSANYSGLGDIRSVSEYLDAKDYGIHSITDADGHIAHALGLGEAVFYHTASTGSKGSGRANSNTIGIEQISRVMLDHTDRAARYAAWLHMDKELNATAKLVAALARAHKFPLQLNNGDTTKPGITTHYEVSKRYGVEGGHVDCFPYHLGGYYPLKMVVALARRYSRLGYRF